MHNPGEYMSCAKSICVEAPRNKLQGASTVWNRACLEICLLFRFIKNKQTVISVLDDIPRNQLAPGFADLILILFLTIQERHLFLCLTYGTLCTGYDKHS